MTENRKDSHKRQGRARALLKKFKIFSGKWCEEKASQTWLCYEEISQFWG
jgi:hypothetical protein